MPEITPKQRSSIHIAFRRYVKLLNEGGLTINKAIEADLLHLEIDWTEQNFKESIGRLMLTTMYPEKTSFNQLNTKETQDLFEQLNSNMARVFGISIQFPTKENNNYEEV